MLGHSHHNSNSVGNILGGASPMANPSLNNQRYDMGGASPDVSRFQSEAENKNVR